MKRIPTQMFLPALLLLPGLLSAQTAPQNSVSQTQTPSPETQNTASAILNPSISVIQQALDGVRLERWKISGQVRDETQANIASIRRDLESTLPPLIATADEAPESVTQILPVFRNVEALYDVLLRVSYAGHIAAPPPQSTALEEATASLETARRTLGDQIQTSAAAQDHKVAGLQASLRAVPPPAPAPACPPPPPPAKKHKPKPKPATTQPTQ